MLPKTGKVFPGGHGPENGSSTYAGLIAAALQSELGPTHRAAKTLVRWTGAGERTAKHWLAGRHGPAGDYLIVLMRQSDAVFEAILSAADRQDAITAVRVLRVHGALTEVMALIGSDRLGHQEMDRPIHPKSRKGATIGRDAQQWHREDGTRDGREDPASFRLNPRQRWFVAELASGRRMTAADLQQSWHVSERTARRDLAILKSRNLIAFHGSFRTGTYRLRGKAE